MAIRYVYTYTALLLNAVVHMFFKLKLCFMTKRLSNGFEYYATYHKFYRKTFILIGYFNITEKIIIFNFNHV